MDVQAAMLEVAEWIHVAQDRDMKRVRIIPYNWCEYEQYSDTSANE